MKKLAKKWRKLKKLPLIIVAVFAFEFSFPQASFAQSVELGEFDKLNTKIVAREEQAPLIEQAPAPAVEEQKPKRVVYITVTAYSSTADQTDDTPCVTANGLNVCERDIEDVVAANFLPFRTKIRLPDYFGEEQYFYVHDRMNKRYPSRIDIWMKSREAAKQFGVRQLKMEIY